MRASCANDEKQIGIACSIYASDYNDFLPTIALRSADNFYNTAVACRLAGIPSSSINTGPFGLGQLYFYAGVANPQVFYCPSVLTGEYAFTTYVGPGYPWPSTPVNYPYGPNAFIRCGYNYYPQPKTTQLVSLASGNVPIASQTFTSQTFTPPNPPGGTANTDTYMTPVKISQVNLNKAMGVDSLRTWGDINHKYRGNPYGLNAVFPDGHVRFQAVSQMNQRNSFAPFDYNDCWNVASGQGPGETPYGNSSSDAAIIIMNGFQP
jgi:hypothetical protein